MEEGEERETKKRTGGENFTSGPFFGWARLSPERIPDFLTF